jgi:hypothetical protein
MWLHLKRFRFEPSMSDDALIHALLDHERYRDHYTTDDDHWEPTDNLHGPYWLDRIGMDSFDAISATDATKLLCDWSSLGEPSDEPYRENLLDTAKNVIDEATSLLRLRNLRATAEHDWGCVLGEFHEFIAINRGRRLLTLMVASDD